MSKHVVHISELEAASEFVVLLKRLRAGEEIVIKDDSRPLAVVHPVEPAHRSISECIALAKEHETAGETPVLDPDFADDMQEILQQRALERNSASGRDFDALMERLQHVKAGRRFTRDETNQR